MIDAALRQSVSERAQSRCEYCLLPQSAHLLTFPIDHIIARQHGGESQSENLALSCVRCNSAKGPNIAGIDPQSRTLTPLFHPRRNRWSDHFRLERNWIIGTTAIGRTTVHVLQFNHPDYLALRSSLQEEGSYPRSSG